MGIPELERYQIIEELGQGGMSIVYRARDRQLNRVVAVKVLHDFLARQEESRRRFHREAVAVAKLHHPGIVEIFDYSGPDAEQSYIVCELVDGRTLRSLVDDDGPIRHPELGALVTAELTRALRHAHEQGIIHRDLKPENIMVTRDGRLKLMDFGIAQIIGGATRLTATGTLLGSPAHMAPEMIDGHPCDHRGDIFSVGTILYWLATGSLPFDAPNPSALFRQILEGVYEPPQAVQPGIGNGLARIIDRALALTPEARYQDISELQDDLHVELEAVDLVPVEACAREYLSRPRAFTDEFRPRIVERLTQMGEHALDERNLGRAMDRFNRVLAVEPGHPEVLALVRKVGRRRAFAARMRQAAIAVSMLVGIAGVGIGAYGLWPASPPAEAKRAESDLRSSAMGTTRVEAPRPAPPETTTATAVESASAPKARRALEAPTAPARAGGDEEQRRPTPRPSVPRLPPRETAVARRPRPTPPPQPEPTRAPRPATPKTLGADTNAPAKPATDAGAPSTTADDVASLRTRPSDYPLLLRMHPGWANVWLNGERVAEGAYRARLRLSAGRHEIRITNQFGERPPRIIVVDDEGRMMELRPDGARLPVRGELPIYTPSPATRDDKTDAPVN